MEIKIFCLIKLLMSLPDSVQINFFPYALHFFLNQELYVIKNVLFDFSKNIFLNNSLMEKEFGCTE